MELHNRTIICTVLFLDIVEYSRKPVAEQMKLRDRFNLLLREALDGVASNDRIILDTGDGAAVTFLGEPEGAVLTALRLREAIEAELLPREHQLSLRCGINLGPVKLVKDINSRPNIIGDGINVAQRIMGFSQPGQVLISRSCFEVVSRLSDEYANLFQYEGSRTDKHVREHEVYALSSDEGPRVRASVAGESTWKATARRLAPSFFRLADRLPASPLGSTLVAMLAILAVGGVMRVTRDAPYPRVAERAPIAERGSVIDLSAYPPAAAGGVQPASVQEPVVAAPATPIPVVAIEASPSSAEITPAKVAVAKKPAPRLKAAAVPAAPDESMKTLDVAKVAPAESEVTVGISIAAFPWGEIYVDGTRHGVTPPVHSIHVRPGRHEIEIRNTTFPSHRSTVDVGANDRITIRHRFTGAEQK